MKIERRNLIYSAFLAAVLVTLTLGYFLTLLPSLYTDYMRKANLKAVEDQQRSYLDKGSYEGLKLKNITASFTLEIPKDGYTFTFVNGYGRADITIKKDEIKKILDDVREQMEKEEEIKDFGSFDTKSFEPLFSDIFANLGDSFDTEALPVDIDYKAYENQVEAFTEGTLKVHTASDDIMILEATTSDKVNEYTSLLAMSKKDGSLVVSFLPTMIGDMSEIRGVVIGSLPMIIGVILLMVLVLSFLYSKGIIRPLFDSLEDKNRELDEKNAELMKENEKQEMFLRATSHQLKTPLASALLLTDGMMGNVGKYSDRDLYLAKLKEQLISMRGIIDEVLSLHGRDGKREMADINVTEAVKGLAASQKIRCEEKNVTLEITGDEDVKIRTDGELLVKIVDNLVSNAVNYSPEGSTVKVDVTPGRITVENPGHIEDGILEHVQEPFVAGTSGGHGLGLYIASYYAKTLGYSLSVTNDRDSVRSTLDLV